MPQVSEQCEHCGLSSWSYLSQRYLGLGSQLRAAACTLSLVVVKHGALRQLACLQALGREVLVVAAAASADLVVSLVPTPSQLRPGYRRPDIPH